MLSRRALLQRGAIAGAAVMFASACAVLPRARNADAARRARELVPVNVSRDRVIRTEAGLRPFRSSGFVVRGEGEDGKLLVHNYGHGGGGISLCWGSSMLAVELAMQSEQRRAAVLGCGAMGLTTARLLQDRGFDVTIYARDLPPQTTSNVAGAQWSPYTVFDNGQTSPAFDAQFERAARISHRYFQNMIGSVYGVRWIENYVLSQTPLRPQSGPLADLYPASDLLEQGEHPFNVPHVRVFTTMLIEPPLFLHAVMQDYLLRGGRIVVREFRDRGDVLRLDENVVVNCTGLGSRALFNDEQLIPIKGQLVFLLPQPEVDYITLAGDYYMFPRTDGILLGGTRERDDWSTEPTAAAIQRIIDAQRAIFDNMRSTAPSSSLELS